MKKQPLSYTKQFLFVLSFNVAPYFQLKNLFYLFNILKSLPLTSLYRKAGRIIRCYSYNQTVRGNEL